MDKDNSKKLVRKSVYVQISEDGEHCDRCKFMRSGHFGMLYDELCVLYNEPILFVDQGKFKRCESCLREN